MSLLPKIQISDETARPIVNAVLDVFSPATELLGWVGDAIRVHRTRTVLRCFSRTKEIAAKAGIRLKAPPTKFLAQYIENCSLEEESDRFLIEWWSRLLVDAGTNYQGKHVFYVSVLKQLSVIEIELLECIVRNGASPRFSKRVVAPGLRLSESCCAATTLRARRDCPDADRV